MWRYLEIYIYIGIFINTLQVDIFKPVSQFISVYYGMTGCKYCCVIDTDKEKKPQNAFIHARIKYLLPLISQNMDKCTCKWPTWPLKAIYNHD